MKQLMMTMLLAIVAMTATAQDKKAGEINEKYFDARVSELVYRLDMSDDQKAKFTPIYKRYCEEMKAPPDGAHVISPWGPRDFRVGKR